LISIRTVSAISLIGDIRDIGGSTGADLSAGFFAFTIFDLEALVAGLGTPLFLDAAVASPWPASVRNAWNTAALTGADHFTRLIDTPEVTDERVFVHGPGVIAM